MKGHRRRQKAQRTLFSWEPLEQRIAPTVGIYSQGEILSFSGDFNIVNGKETSTFGQAVQIGFFVTNPSDFSPMLEVDGGQVSFDSSGSTFQITGSVKAAMPGKGVPSLPLMSALNNLTVDSNQLVNGDFSTSGLSGDYTFSPGPFTFTISSIGLGKDPNENNAPSLELQGSLTVKLGSSGQSQSGISASINGTDHLYINGAAPLGFDFTGLSLSITESFDFLGVTFEPDGLTLDLESDYGSFGIYGSVKVTTKTPDGSSDNSAFVVKASANLGTESLPGLTVSDWKVTEFNLGVSGEVAMGGLTVQANNLSISYEEGANSDFIMSGGISLTLAGTQFSATLGGSNGKPGLEIDQSGIAQFGGLTLSMSNLELGDFGIKKFSLSYASGTGGKGPDYTLSGLADVSLPGNWTVDGSFSFGFDNGEFELLELGVSVTGAIPLGDTDIFVTSIAGEINGLGTQNWSVSGSIGLGFGQAINGVRIVQAEGGFTVDKDELDLTGSVGILASVDSNGNIHSVIGTTVQGTVDLDWAAETYTVEVNGSFAEGLFTVDGEFQFDHGNILLTAYAGLNVPTSIDGIKIPLIGGKKLASANFVFEYDENNGAPDGFFAAWVDLPIVKDVGIKYDLETQKVSFLGNSAIAKIESGENNSENFFNYYQTFTPPDGSNPGQPAGATSFSFIAQWINPGADYYITIEMPDGTTFRDDSSQHIIDEGGPSSGKVSVQNISGLSAPSGQTVLGLQISNYPASLPSGTYKFTLSTLDTLDQNAIVWSALAGYGAPSSLQDLAHTVTSTALNFTQQVAVNSTFVSDNKAKATLYMDTKSPSGLLDLEQHGVQVATTTTFNPTGQTGDYNIAFSLDLTSLDLPPGTYYFYSVVNDGFDAPLISKDPVSYTPAPPLTGTLTETGDGRNQPLSGFTVYIDLQGTGTYAPGDPIAITDADGTYSFYNGQGQNLSFRTGLTPSFNPTGPATNAVLGDFNHDGKLDLAVFLQNSGQIEVFNGNGDGTFAAPRVITKGVPKTIVDMETGDFNGDGIADLLVLSTDGTVTALYGGSSDQELTTSQTLVTPFISGLTYYGMAVGDDFQAGGNRSSFVVYGVDPNQHEYVVTESSYNVGLKSFYTSANYIQAPLVGTIPPVSAHAVAIGDLNKDGFQDLFLNFGAGSGGNGVADYVLYGDGEGAFGNNGAPNYSIPVPANGGPMALSDLNGDGFLDAATTDYSTSSGHPVTSYLYVLQQATIGSWVGMDGKAVSMSTQGLPVNAGFSGRTFAVPQIAIGDLNNDKKPDIVLAESPYDNLQGQTLTYYNQGNTSSLAQFSDSNSNDYSFDLLYNNAKPNSLALGSLGDATGKLDMVLADASYAIQPGAPTGGIWLEKPTYTVGVVLPSTGYVGANGAPTWTQFTYNGSSVTTNLQVWREATIAGTVFDDLNGDGVQEAGEPGVAGVTVYIDLNHDGKDDSGDPTTSTLTDGSYEFVGLPLNISDLVRYILPCGYLVSAKGKTELSQTLTTTYQLSSGNDFAIVAGATISGTVTGNPIFSELNSNPVPLSGWAVTVTNSAGLSFTAFTNASGNYSFTGLPPGSYTVQESPPAGWKQVSPYSTSLNLAPTFQSNSSPITSVVTSDFNNDGKLDWAGIDDQGYELVVSYGNGTGSFSKTVTSKLSISSPIVDMQTGDFTGNGYIGLLALESDGIVVMIPGSANGPDSSHLQLVYGGGPLNKVYGIATGGDFNGDGKDDFVVYGTEPGSIQTSFLPTYGIVVITSTSSSFQQTANLTMPQFGALTPVSYHAVAIGDLNNDGKLDLFINFGTAGSDVADWVAYGHGDGTFGTMVHSNFFVGNEPDLSFPVPGNGGPVALADLNGDGFLDAVTSDFDGTGMSNFYVFQQTGVANWVGLDDAFASSSSPALPANGPFSGRSFFIPQISLADINGDGKPDITVVESPLNTSGNNEGQFLSYLNLGNDSRGIAQFDDKSNDYSFTFLGVGARPNSLAAGDFNNDGLPDLIVGENTYQGGGDWLTTNTSKTVITKVPLNNVEANGQYQVNFNNVQLGTVSGIVYRDSNGNGQFDAGDMGEAGVTVFIDLNNNGQLDPGDPVTTTNAQGFYSFQGIPAGTTGQVRVTLANPLILAATPLGGYALSLGSADGLQQVFDFGLQPHLLQPVANATVQAGQPLTLQLSLTPGTAFAQINQPGELVYALGDGAPSGLTVNAKSGLLSWTPSANVTPGVYHVTVWLRDTSNPLHTDSRSFTINVDAVPPPPPPPPPPPTPPAPPAIPTPPEVVNVRRYGFGPIPTLLVLTFNEPLDKASAQNAANYTLVGPRGGTIAIKSVVYNPEANTVTVIPQSRLNLFRRYTLLLNGSTPGGVANSSGVLLDGRYDGKPGSNFLVNIIGFAPRIRSRLHAPARHPLSAENSRHASSAHADSALRVKSLEGRASHVETRVRAHR